MKGHKLLAMVSLLALAFSLVLVAPVHSEDPWDADVTGELGFGLGDSGGSGLLGGETAPDGDEDDDAVLDFSGSSRAAFEADWFSRLIFKFVSGFYVKDAPAAAQPTSVSRSN